MSVKTKTVAVAAPGKSQPMGNMARQGAATPRVPATVIMFGVTGVRASAWISGLNRRTKKGLRKVSMADTILLVCARVLWRCGHADTWPRHAAFDVTWALPPRFSP